MLLFYGIIYIWSKHCNLKMNRLRYNTPLALATLQKENVLAWKHVLLHGVYDFRNENYFDEFNLANPKIMALIHTKFWESPLSL